MFYAASVSLQVGPRILWAVMPFDCDAGTGSGQGLMDVRKALCH